MKYSFASIGMILVGIMSLVVIIVFQDITVNNEADYYSLKEAMEASLFESIDIPYYRSFESNGKIKIVEEKFIENFTKRFAKNTMGNSNGYVLEFYDIMESPPKASVLIKNKTGSLILSDDGKDFDVVNKLTGILVGKVSQDADCEQERFTSYYYSNVERSVNKNGVCYVTNANNRNLIKEDENGTGQILRSYSSEIDSDGIYKYSYDLLNYSYYFYNDFVRKDENNKLIYKDDILHDFYTNFTGKDICGYPFYKDKDGYLYKTCVDTILDTQIGGTNFKIESTKIDSIKFSRSYDKDGQKKYHDYADDIIINEFVIRSATEDELMEASDNRLNKADNLYFIYWEGSCEKQKLDGYNKDNVLAVIEITWNVKKCKV